MKESTWSRLPLQEKRVRNTSYTATYCPPAAVLRGGRRLRVPPSLRPAVVAPAPPSEVGAPDAGTEAPSTTPLPTFLTTRPHLTFSARISTHLLHAGTAILSTQTAPDNRRNTERGQQNAECERSFVDMIYSIPR